MSHPKEHSNGVNARIRLCLCRPRTAHNSTRLLSCAGVLWAAGLLALASRALGNDTSQRCLAVLGDMIREGWWPVLRTLGIGVLVFLGIWFALMGVTALAFGMLPDLQSESSPTTLMLVLLAEAIVALVLTWPCAVFLCVRLWP